MDEQKQLLKLIRKTSDARLRLRYTAVLHFKEGKSRSEIARFLKVARRSVNSWISSYLNHGLDSLIKPGRGGRPSKLNAEQKEQLRQYIEKAAQSEEGGRLTGYEIGSYINKTFNTNYSLSGNLSGVYNLLHTLGFSWITSRSKHPKQSQSAQDEFKKKFDIEVIKQIPEHVPLKEVLVWFQDEARFGQQNTTTRLWAKKGTRPRAVQQRQFKYVHCFGAVCINTGQTEAFISPLLNTNAMQIHLEQISKATPADKHSVVIMDKAGWHQLRLAKIYDNLTLIHLPPYSPELNPIEQVWSWLRQHELANRCFANYDAIVDAVSKAWNSLCNDTKTLLSICSRKWAMLGN